VHCLVDDDVFTAFSDNDRQSCRSEALMSVLLRGNKWMSLRTFAVTLQLELV